MVGQVNGKPHAHAFVRDGDEKGLVECEVDATAGVENPKGTLKMGIRDLLGKCLGSMMRGIAYYSRSLEDRRVVLRELLSRGIHYIAGSAPTSIVYHLY